MTSARDTRRTAPRIWSGRPATPSTTPSRQLSRQSVPFLTLSSAASRLRKPSVRSPDCPKVEDAMKPIRILILAGIALTAPPISYAQVAGSTVLGVSVAELRDVTLGWSAKRQILGHAVYNDSNDVIVASDKTVTYAIINAGGFLAVA